ncbi:rhodanese-like domain-containing protein [Thermodesulfobacteriota bacterium]
MPLKNIIKELCILLTISIATAFCVNYFSPKGIALIGQWDPTHGVITAKPKNDVVFHELEIRSPETAKEIYDSGKSVFVDARARDFYNEGHIKGAISLPVGDFDRLIDTFKKDYPIGKYIITYCSGRECGDSHQLAQYLLENGYSDISVFVDGYPGWVEKGYPID